MYSNQIGLLYKLCSWNQVGIIMHLLLTHYAFRYTSSSETLSLAVLSDWIRWIQDSWLYHYGLLVKCINLLLLESILKEDVLAEIVTESTYRNNNAHIQQCSCYIAIYWMFKLTEILVENQRMKFDVICFYIQLMVLDICTYGDIM